MGRIEIHNDFRSADGKPHTLRVYTPDEYVSASGRDQGFPVLYMHDGQNVFADVSSARWDTWCANQAAERMVAEGRIEPWIIVGVDHSAERFEEYSPWDEPRLGVRGRGPEFAAFMVERVKPFIDRIYRTRPEAMWTGTMGASLGALISLYLGCERPDIFGRVGALSPSVMWSDSRIFRHWREHTRHWSRIYLDTGEHEFVQWESLAMDYAGATRAFHAHLASLGYGPHELRLVLEPGARHYETDWARRLPQAFAWLLG